MYLKRQLIIFASASVCDMSENDKIDDDDVGSLAGFCDVDALEVKYITC